MAARWNIVGGADKGGVLVREGEGLKSPQCADRLSTGAIVEQIALKGERLHFRLLTGTGPKEGWISLKISGKVLAEPAPAAEEAPAAAAQPFELPAWEPSEEHLSAKPDAPSFPFPPGRNFAKGAKPKMLYLCGGGVNEKVGRMQIANTFKEVSQKKDIDWTVWNPVHHKVPLGWNGDFSLKMFGPDYYVVFERLPYANSQFEEWQGFETSMREFKKFLKANGPFDGAMGFDMGGEFLAQAARLASEGDRELQECWRFMILFTSSAPKHQSPMAKQRPKAPLKIPTILSYATSDENHPFMEYEELPLFFHKDYREVIVHIDGHKPPSLKKEQEQHTRFTRFFDAVWAGKPFTPSDHPDNAVYTNLWLPILPRLPAPTLPEGAKKRCLVVTDPMGAGPDVAKVMEGLKAAKAKGELPDFDGVPFEIGGPPRHPIETLQSFIDVCSFTHEEFAKEAGKKFPVEGVTYTEEQKNFNWHDTTGIPIDLGTTGTKWTQGSVPSRQIMPKDCIVNEKHDELVKEWARELIASFDKKDDEEVAIVGLGTGAWIALAIARMFVQEKNYVPIGLWVVCPPGRLPWITTATPGVLGACPVSVYVSEYSTYGPPWRYEVSTLGPFKSTVYGDSEEMIEAVINGIRLR